MSSANSQKINYKVLILLFLLGGYLWNMPVPPHLNPSAMHVFIVFMLTIVGIVSSAMPMGAIAFLGVTVLVLTKTLSLNDTLLGFSSSIVWLVVFAFFIARGFIKTNLGNRIAYILVSKLGKRPLGLAYSLVLTEFFLSPMIPSATARGGGIMYPLVKSIVANYDESKRRNASFLVATCFHSNVITSAIFLTAMVSNPLIAGMAATLGVTITWESWAMAAIAPGVVNLLFMPLALRYIIGPNMNPDYEVVEVAKRALNNIGPVSNKEIIMSVTFIVMIGLWIGGKAIGIDATTAAMLGFIVMVITQIIDWNDVVTEKGAWETMLWFAILCMMAESLTALGFTRWVEGSINTMIAGVNGYWIIIAIVLAFFYSHYFFASITTHASVLFLPFALALIQLGIKPEAVALGLAFLATLSGGLTHYGISTAPIYFSGGYFSTKQWWKIGFILSSASLLIWSGVASVWWKVLGII